MSKISREENCVKSVIKRPVNCLKRGVEKVQWQMISCAHGTSLMRGNRNVGDTSNVTSKITSLHKCFIYSNINIFENEER